MRLVDADKIIFREIDEVGGEYEPYLGCSKSQIDSLPSVIPQPCEDAISRQALLNATVKKSSIWNHITNSDGDNLEAIVSKLPPVTPQEPKTGHWVHGEYCSECGCDVPAYIIDWKWQKDMDAKYCSNCGAKMEKRIEEVEE